MASIEEKIKKLEDDIQAVQNGNPNWRKDAGDKALVTSYNLRIAELEKQKTSTGTTIASFHVICVLM
jgi:hypothetical protein